MALVLRGFNTQKYAINLQKVYLQYIFKNLIKFKPLKLAIFTFCKSNTMAYDIIQEGKFSYIEEGTGEPLVLLHGLFGALSNFSDLFNHFKDKYRVIIPMLPLYDLPAMTNGGSNMILFIDPSANGNFSELASTTVSLTG